MWNKCKSWFDIWWTVEWLSRNGRKTMARKRIELVSISSKLSSRTGCLNIPVASRTHILFHFKRRCKGAGYQQYQNIAAKKGQIIANGQNGLVRDLNPGPLAPKATSQSNRRVKLTCFPSSRVIFAFQSVFCSFLVSLFDLAVEKAFGAWVRLFKWWSILVVSVC